MRRLACILTALAVGCGEPSGPPAPTSIVVAAPESPAPDSPELPLPPPSALAPATPEPDLVVAIPPGDAHRTLSFPLHEPACRFDRAELSLEIESMPDGYVTLSVAGARDRRSLRVLSSTHFVHTWDWADLDGLHGARGAPIGDAVELELALRGAFHCGGSCAGGASRMDEPQITSGEIRLWCARDAIATDAPVVRTIGSLIEGHPTASGQDAVARFRVASRCAIDEAHVEVRGEARFGGARFVVTMPDGTTRAVGAWTAVDDGGERKYVAAIPRVSGEPSDGVWEMRAIRAGPDVTIEGASITIDCASEVSGR